MRDIEAAWLAGLLEGEGYFAWVARKETWHGSPRVIIAMNDYDVLRRAALLMKPASILKSKKDNTWRIELSHHKAIEVMKVVLPYMGQRRTERITLILEKWENRPTRSSASRAARLKYWASKSHSERLELTKHFPTHDKNLSP